MGGTKDEAESVVAAFSEGGEGWRQRIANEQPRHKVTLSPFLISKYEVTQAEWRKVMGNSPSD